MVKGERGEKMSKNGEKFYDDFIDDFWKKPGSTLAMHIKPINEETSQDKNNHKQTVDITKEFLIKNNQKFIDEGIGATQELDHRISCFVSDLFLEFIDEPTHYGQKDMVEQDKNIRYVIYKVSAAIRPIDNTLQWSENIINSPEEYITIMRILKLMKYLQLRGETNLGEKVDLLVSDEDGENMNIEENKEDEKEEDELIWKRAWISFYSSSLQYAKPEKKSDVHARKVSAKFKGFSVIIGYGTFKLRRLSKGQRKALGHRIDGIFQNTVDNNEYEGIEVAKTCQGPHDRNLRNS
ncbi:hypothetical protein RhiirA4_540242 [Rhizophagus irregularis]|uniref:Uncharacterized protein n=1 Tax=Rhizophagus irregularis TaxID=588596 RepID=A0A2I1G6F8_9GLOM|nr:hypothetical protein RhiirA4_540242 [Rhizophagus irregularis]